MKLQTSLILSVCFGSMLIAASRGAEPIDIGSRLEPLIDDYLIARSKDGKTVYAIMLGWPESDKKVSIKSLASGDIDIQDVSVLLDDNVRMAATESSAKKRLKTRSNLIERFDEHAAAVHIDSLYDPL